MALGLGMTACTDLDEKVYDRVDASVYYQNETSIKGAVAAIYGQTSQTLAGENFFHLSEYPADQITWRVWNGGLWGWDEAEKTVLSWHNWNSESTIIKNAMPPLWACLPTNWLSMLPRFVRCVPGTTTASSSCGVARCL